MSLGRRANARRGAWRRCLLRASTRLRRPWLDRMILRGVERPGDRGLALRKAQLVERRARHRLAARLAKVLAQKARIDVLSSAAPIDHQAVTVARPFLAELILTLRSSGPVEPRGVVAGRRLLIDPCSPLYERQAKWATPNRLAQATLAILLALRPFAVQQRNRLAGNGPLQSTGTPQSPARTRPALDEASVTERAG